jgi:recombination protein RecT
MVRATQLLHPQREPVATRPAATVLLLRDSPQGIEVLMTRRSATASFAPGAYVFPGGVIDPGETPQAAAVRESREELLLDLTGVDLFVLAHWITDRDLPRRFDVSFLVARMPEGQTPVADEAEQFEPVWVRPADALERHEQGTFFIIFPTIRTLDRLAKYKNVDDVLAACAGGKPLWSSCPRAGFLKGAEVRYMEHEMPYGELALVSPDGQLVHHLDWQPDQPVSLLRNVMRLTAPNPGVMTGPGTNSYLVGDPATGYIAIDPGPNDPEHIDRLWRAAGGNIRFIVCTHSHADHSPGARPLQAMCAHKPPILGIASKPTARAASEFSPDRELADGAEVFVEAAGTRHTLRAIHTPGHAANHTCLLLVEDALLFSGDHILNGSTTVIDPPDGDMTAYIESLDKLAAACNEFGIEFILPAHGHVLGFAPKAIAHLKAHRLHREAKILGAMRAKPRGSMEEWVEIAYEDVPPRMWPVAQRSLLAHVQRIEALGLL